MTALAGRLTAAEEDYLIQCEETISNGLTAFMEVGNALAAVRDNRLYRAEFGTFEEYCAQRWGFTDSRARQLILAAATVTTVTVDGLPAPANEAQARELARIPEADRAEVWRGTIEATDGKPTAAAIRAAATPDRPSATGEAHAGLAPAEVPVSEAPTAPTVGAGETATGFDLGPVDATDDGPAWTPSADAAPDSDGQKTPESGVTPDRKQNRRPLPDAFRDSTWDLVKVVERLDRLTTDDRFPRNAKQVARMSRGDLLRAVDLLAVVVDRLHTSMKESTE